MKKLSTILIMPVALFAAACGENNSDDSDPAVDAVELVPVTKADGLAVVESIELDRYLGTWYEIASIPQWFQGYCVGGVTADYSLRDDGDVRVLNACYDSNGEQVELEGLAWITDESTPGKLLVSFLGSKDEAFGADYWVIELAADYSHAVVGHPQYEYGWILSRTKTLDPVRVEGILSRLTEAGYDISRFVFTNQVDY